jgi:hypothetical protein
MARTAMGRGPVRFDSEQALRELGPKDREVLRLAIVEGRPLEEIGATFGSDGGGATRVARALRRAADLGGAPAGQETEHDGAIAEYLFSSQTVASRDLTAKRLIRDDGVSPGDLRELESVLDDLGRALRSA